MVYQVKRAIDFDLKVEQWSYGMALSYYRGIDVRSLKIAKKMAGVKHLGSQC